MEENILDLAKEEIAKQKFSTALNLLKSLKITPSNIDDVYFHFAKVYYYLEKFSSSQKYLKKTVKSKNTDIIKNYSFYYLAKIYIKQNRYLKALNLLNKTKNIDIKNELESIFSFVVNKATFFNMKGEYDKTKNLYNKYNCFFSNIENVFLKNKFLNEYELASKQTILKSKPRSFLVVLSNLCNLKCIMCNQNKKIIKHINKKIIQVLIDNLPFCEKIFWQGGETLILPYLKTLLTETLKYKQISQTIITNFQVVKEEIMNLLIKNNIRLIISIDSTKKENYEKIRIGAKFDKLIKNITKLNSLKNKLNKYIFMQINFVIMKENYNEIIDILYFAKKYNFNMVSFIQEQHDEWKQRQQFTDIEKKKIIKLLKEANNIAKKLNITIEKIVNFDIYNSKYYCDKSSKKSSDNKIMHCHLPWYKITLSYQNLIYVDYFCNFLKLNKNFIIKDIYDLWNSKLFVNYRDKIIKNNIDYCNYICKNINLNYRYSI